MDTYEKLIDWGLQMSQRYQKYLDKIPKLGRISDDMGIKVMQWLDMPGIDPDVPFDEQYESRPSAFNMRNAYSKEEKDEWKKYNPGVFLGIVDYGVYGAYTEDFADSPVCMAVKLMCYHRYLQSDLSAYSRNFVDESIVHAATLYMGANGYCVLDPLSELEPVRLGLYYKDRLERAIKRRVGMVYEAPEIWEDKEAEVALQTKEGGQAWGIWKTHWSTEGHKKEKEKHMELERERNLYNVK